MTNQQRCPLVDGAHAVHRAALSAPAEMLQRVALGERLDHGAAVRCAGGEHERVASAPALATKAPVILADAPTGKRATATGHEIIDFLRAVVQAEHVTVLIATHDPAVVAGADVSYHRVNGTLRREE